MTPYPADEPARRAPQPAAVAARLAVARQELDTAQRLGRSRDAAAFRIAVQVLEEMVGGPAATSTS